MAITDRIFDIVGIENGRLILKEGPEEFSVSIDGIKEIIRGKIDVSNSPEIISYCIARKILESGIDYNDKIAVRNLLHQTVIRI